MATLNEIFAQGAQLARDTQRDRQRKAAQDEAFKKFGPVADNPALFQQIENVLNTRANRERNDRVTEQNLALQQSRETRAQTEFTAAQARNKREIAANVINGLRIARDRGDDLGEAFDSLIPALEDLGVDPANFDRMRQTIIDNPARLDELAVALGGGQAATASGKAAAGSQNAEDTSPAGIADAESSLLKVDQAIERLDNLLDPANEAAVNAALGAPNLRKLGKGGFGSFGTVPGTPAFNAAADIEGLQGDVRSEAFETLKGGGQITEKESEFAAQAIANLDRGVSPDKFRRELRDLRKFFIALRRAAAIRANGGTVPDLTTNLPTTLENPENLDAESSGGFTGNARIEIGTTLETPSGVRVFQGGDPRKLENWKLVERRGG